MGEGNFCEPDWKPNSTVNQFMDGLEYGLSAPFMKETLDEYSRRRIGERQQHWQKQVDDCEADYRRWEMEARGASFERWLARIQSALTEKYAEQENKTRHNSRYTPLDFYLQRKRQQNYDRTEESFRGSNPRDFKGMKPDPQQEKKEEDFFRKVYE